MERGLTLVGLVVAVVTLAAILWSIARPTRRIWPPRRYTIWTPVLVWVPTFGLFGTLVALGVLGWGEVGIPNWLRFGVGIPLILSGHLAVWSEVLQFGMPQTSGAAGTLRTEGLYRFSRHPQYVADIGMVLGWMLLSSAPLALLVGGAAITLLVAAPFAEEPWLRSQYGHRYEEYATRVRRFL